VRWLLDTERDNRGDADTTPTETAGTEGGETVIYEFSDASMLDDPNYVSDSKAFFSYVDADPSAKEHVKLVLGKVRIPLIDINGESIAGYN
jgi:hypothetical protein